MNFITMKESQGQDVAVNVSNITQIRLFNGKVCLMTGDSLPVSTSFTSVRHAVQYVLDYAPRTPKTKELS